MVREIAQTQGDIIGFTHTFGLIRVCKISILRQTTDGSRFSKVKVDVESEMKIFGPNYPCGGS